MATLSVKEIADLLGPYLGPSGGLELPTGICEKLGRYLELLLKWNSRINMTAIRKPEEIVQRHFGESLFVASQLPVCETLLDFGSGAGFPGIPIQLMRPGSRVTLAESQSRKAAFLREAVRELGLGSEVWDGRVEAMPRNRRFDVVTLRAVDRMASALSEAGRRAGKQVAVIGTSGLVAQLEVRLPDFDMADPIALPGTRDGFLFLANRTSP